MPELPEVETVRRTLLPHVVGRRIERVTVRDHRLRFPVDPQRLAGNVRGATITGVRRRAKYLLFDLEGAGERRVLLVHLGMTGRLAVVPSSEPLLAHDHVVWRLEGGRDLRFNDARRFGFVDAFGASAEAVHPRLHHLGLEPLGESFRGPALYAATRGVRQPVKGFLMNSARVVGVGNIYASEALFAAGIHPSTPAGRLSRDRWVRLVRAVRATLRSAIDDGGTTLRDFRDAEGMAGEFAPSLRVYGRTGEPCPRCGAAIRRQVHAGRSTWYCARCQT